MAYSGVALGLLHGSMPDMLIMCHEPIREIDTFNQPMHPVINTLNLYLDLMKVFKPCVCVGFSLITYSESDEAARETIRNYSSDFSLPAEDLVRFRGESIIDNIIDRLNRI